MNWRNKVHWKSSISAHWKRGELISESRLTNLLAVEWDQLIKWITFIFSVRLCHPQKWVELCMSEIPDLTPGSVVFLHDYVTGLSFSKLSFKYTKSASLKFIIIEKNNIAKTWDKYLWIKIFPNSNCVDFRGMTLRMLLANYLILTVTRC